MPTIYFNPFRPRIRRGFLLSISLKAMEIHKFNNLMKQQDLSNLFFPEASTWMWDYCLYLGSKVIDGKSYDMGVHVCEQTKRASAAIVFSNLPGSYLSGEIEDNPSPIYTALRELLSEPVRLNLTGNEIKGTIVPELKTPGHSASTILDCILQFGDASLDNFGLIFITSPDQVGLREELLLRNLIVETHVQ